MKRHSIITKYQIVQAVKLFRQVYRRQLCTFFTQEENGRLKALEEFLPSLEKEEILAATWYRGEKVYSLPKKLPVEANLEHELAAVEVMIRLYLSRKEAIIIPERDFRGFAIVPEGGFKYSKVRGSMLIFEFHTEKNFNHGSVMKSKLTRYYKYLDKIEAKFQRDITVLFVINTTRAKVGDYVEKRREYLAQSIASGFSGKEKFPFFFTDYETFTSIPIGQALTAPIYFWHDGKEWPLSYD